MYLRVESSHQSLMRWMGYMDDDDDDDDEQYISDIGVMFVPQH